MTQKQIRLKDGIILINCCECRNNHPEDLPCPCKNNDAHGDGDDGCNLDVDLILLDESSIRGRYPDDCPLEDA